ncbi:hypothetical protein N9N67_11655 [Bacteriovoracaceae bacterium]|nr:hypothetical protein [Bacteriovoracaceae bacterium]
MKKSLFCFLAAAILLVGTMNKAQAGVIGAVRGTVYSITQAINEDPLYLPVGLVVTTIIGGGLIWGGSALINNNSSGSVGAIAGIVLVVLEDASVDEFESFVTKKYPNVISPDFKNELAQELKAQYEANVANGEYVETQQDGKVDVVKVNLPEGVVSDLTATYGVKSHIAEQIEADFAI